VKKTPQTSSAPMTLASTAAAAPAAVSAAIRNRADIESTIRATVASCVAASMDAQADAVSGLAASQAELSGELVALIHDMNRVSDVVEGLSLDPATSRRMVDARDSLQRTRTRLVTVRGRLGRLRGFEESQRLRVAAPSSTEMKAMQTSLRSQRHQAPQSYVPCSELP
jgi:hypothetical protein